MSYEHLMGTQNQLANTHNYFQGKYPRVLFLCSAGLLRSATAAHTFSQEPYNWNTRTAGVAIEYALNPVSIALLEWADVVYVMEYEHRKVLERIFGERFDEYKEKVHVLNVSDNFRYRDPKLVKLLKQKLPSEIPVLFDEVNVD